MTAKEKPEGMELFFIIDRDGAIHFSDRKFAMAGASRFGEGRFFSDSELAKRDEAIAREAFYYAMDNPPALFVNYWAERNKK